MSETNVNLAVIMRRAQRQDPEEAVNTLNELVDSLNENGLASYFSSGALSQDERLFMQDFFYVLHTSIGGFENLVSFRHQNLMHLKDIERAKELTRTFGIHLVEGGSGMLYLSWCKGIFDKE